VEFPSSGERAKARCGGNLYSCATRERRIAHPNCDTNPRADASVPDVSLVRREAAASALHPNTRSNGTTGERIAEPVGGPVSISVANRSHAATESIRGHCPGPITRNDAGVSGRAS
jgi:hypothetical protein